MALYEIYEKAEYKKLFLNREELINDLQEKNSCDVLVVGGGIIGACVAHAAAFNGLRVVLLEMNDYASGTTSATNNLVIGNTQFFNPLHLRNAVREITNLSFVAQHLLKPVDLLIRGKLPFTQLLCSKLSGRYDDRDHFRDAYLPSVRYALDRIYAARQEGARCLNYAKADALFPYKNGGADVLWKDVITGNRYRIRAGVVVNCTGMGSFAGLTGYIPNNAYLVRSGCCVVEGKFSLPSMLVCDKGCIAVNNTGDKVIIGQFEEAAQKRNEESAEFQRLIRDWVKENLPEIAAAPCRIEQGYFLRPKNSRSYFWDSTNGIFSLVGGNISEASAIADQLIKNIIRFSNADLKFSSLRGRPLAGSAYMESNIQEFMKTAESSGVSHDVIMNCVRRWGGRVSALTQYSDAFSLSAQNVLNAEINYAKEVEQAIYPEDIIRRLSL